MKVTLTVFAAALSALALAAGAQARTDDSTTPCYSDVYKFFAYVEPTPVYTCTTTTEDWSVSPTYDGPAYTDNTAAAAAEPPPPAPAPAALPTWRNLYDWPNGHGYVGWHSASSPASGAYGIQSNLGGQYGLWLWPVGNQWYNQTEYAEWTYTAPGTTRLASAQLSFSYRNKLLAHHCIDVGFRDAAGNVIAVNTHCQPAHPPDSQRGVDVSLVDPKANPTSKTLFFRVRMACNGSQTTCSKYIPSLDPLTNGPMARLLKVDMTLVDDDIPTVTASNDFTEQTYVAGRETFPLTITAEDLGAGVNRAWAERLGGGVIASQDAPCDPTHKTPALDARICPDTFSYTASVPTTAFPEGRNDFIAKATDLAANRGTSSFWTMLVDRTGPTASTSIDFSNYDAATRTASIDWDSGDDPALPTGEDGSGIGQDQYRYQVNGGAWSAWTDPDVGSDERAGGFDAPNVGIGDVIGVEARQLDAVGNTGATGSGTLTLSGAVASGNAFGPFAGVAVSGNEPVPVVIPPGMPEQGYMLEDDTIDPGDFGALALRSVLSKRKAAARKLAAFDVPVAFDATNPCGLGPEANDNKILSTGDTSTDPTKDVSWKEYPRCIVFWNNDASWTIYKSCFQQVEYNDPTTRRDIARRRATGPGYISVVRDSRGFVVNDFRWRTKARDNSIWNPGNLGGTNGGLGTFELQYARGKPNGVWGGEHDYADPKSANPTQTFSPPRAGNWPDVGMISERTCADSYGGSGPTGHVDTGWGVYDTDFPVNGPLIKADKPLKSVRYRVDVWIEDPWSSGTDTSGGNKALIRVRHDYRFFPNSVEAAHTVTLYGIGSDANNVPMAKEPKIGAAVRADGRYTQMRVYASSVGSTSPLGAPVTRGQPELPGAGLFTRQAENRTRVRVRWECASASACAAGDATHVCAVGCFNVVMKARAIPSSSTDVFRARTYPWETPTGGTARGFDLWALQEAAQPLKAYPRDTDGDADFKEPVITSYCSVPTTRKERQDHLHLWGYVASRSAESTPALQSVRQWELVGWKNGATTGGDHPNLTYSGSGVLFNAWEGQRGPYDCEPLLRVFPTAQATTRTYSTYARYWINTDPTK